MPYWKQVLPYFVFALFIILYGSRYYGQLVPNDAVAYISIAEKYATGHFGTAINAYWSPLFCWLIAIQLKIGLSVNAAIFCIQVLAGVGIIFLSGKIIAHYQWPVWAQVMCHTLISVWAALFSLRFATPDSLMACGLLLYLYFLIRNKWFKYPLLTGLLGAGLYFTKAFGFYFFPACLLLFSVGKMIVSRDGFRFLLRKTATILISFLLAILPWIAAIHHRYGKWMISSAGSYNHNLMRYGDGSIQPALKSGLLPLPDASANNAWEEITLVHSYTDWSPFHSTKFFWLQINVIYNNLKYVLLSVYSIHMLMWLVLPISMLLAAWYITTAIRRKKTDLRLRTSVGTLTFISLYTFGYCIAGMDYRYLYIVYVGMIFLFFDLVVLVSNRFPKARLICYLIVTSIVVQSLYNISKGLYMTGGALDAQMSEMKRLKKLMPPESIVATHATNSINAMDYWGKWHNHGGLEAYTNQQEAWQALLKYRVQWVLIPIAEQVRYTWLSAYSDTVVGTPRWKVYKLKTAGHLTHP